MRLCEGCGVNIDHKRSDARFCTRRCRGNSRYSRLDPDSQRHLNQTRYQREKAKRQRYARDKYWEDHERSIERSRTWRKENPDRRRSQRDKRAHLMRTNPGYVPFGYAEWRKVVNRQRGLCFYCGKYERLTMDHVVPLCRGGRHAIANIVGACGSCNKSKNGSLLIEWRLRLQGR